MALKTGDQYIQSIRNLNMEVYMFGERIPSPVDHPILRPSLNSVRMTYDLAQLPEHEDLMTTVSHLTGERINRFTNIHQSSEDLVKKVKMQRLLGKKPHPAFSGAWGWMRSTRCTPRHLRWTSPTTPSITKTSAIL